MRMIEQVIYIPLEEPLLCNIMTNMMVKSK